jgi:hypothetical protein
LQLIVLIIIIAFVINIGHYTRNYLLYGSPIGPGQEEGGFKYSNDVFSISTITSNVIRNIGLHIGTPYYRVNDFLNREIFKVFRIIGINPNDTRTTWPGTEFKILNLSITEDNAGNPLHLILILVSMPILFLQQNKKRDAKIFLVFLVVAFILFCFYLKWQPWNSRLQLSLFILWSSLIGLFLAQFRVHWIADLCLVVLLLGAVPYLLINPNKNIIGQENIFTTSRTELYFKGNPSLADSYISSVQFLSKTQCADIGLEFGSDDWEYPFWVLLGKDDKQKVRLEHVNVTNISQELSTEFPFNNFTPCAVIVVSDNPSNEINVDGVTYIRKWLSNPVSVFLQK